MAVERGAPRPHQRVGHAGHHLRPQWQEVGRDGDGLELGEAEALEAGGGCPKTVVVDGGEDDHPLGEPLLALGRAEDRVWRHQPMPPLVEDRGAELPGEQGGQRLGGLLVRRRPRRSRSDLHDDEVGRQARGREISVGGAEGTQ